MQLVHALKVDKTDKFSDIIQKYPQIMQLVMPIESKIEQSIQLKFKLLDLRKMAS